MKQKVPQQAIEQQNSVDGNTKSTEAKYLASPAHDIQFSIQKKEKDHSSETLARSISPPASGINFAIQKKENKTGLPDHLKSGIENLSGHAMDDVKVHYNSSQPAQLNAHAYAQGNQIHIAPGQEKHLAHEAWHVVQQKQGRVKPTKQLKSSVAINDDAGLEKEADVMGAKALQMPVQGHFIVNRHTTETPIMQLKPWAPAVAAGLVPGNVHIPDVIVGGQPFQGLEFSHILPPSADKTTALTDAAIYIAGLNVPLKNNFLTQAFLNTHQVAATVAGPYNAAAVPAHWPGQANGWNNYINGFDPFLVRVTVQYPNPVPAHQIVLTYEFGRASYGYIVRIQQNGGNFTMNNVRGQNVPLGPNEYASGHDTHASANDVSTVANQDTSDHAIAASVPDRAISWTQIGAASVLVGAVMAYKSKSLWGVLSGLATALSLTKVRTVQQEMTELDRRKERSKRLDAIAKIAGEGPRWVCVRTLAMAGNLHNDSKIYTTDPATGIRHFITFATLWASWDSAFSARFNIPDLSVRNSLLNPATVWNGAGKQQIAAGVATNWNGHDIQV